MFHPKMKSIQLYLCVAILVSIFIASSATAQIVPMLVERDSEDNSETFWWISPEATPTGLVDSALFAQAATSSLWISPQQTTPSETISRLYRVSDIPETNARNLARFYGGQFVLIGETRWITNDGVPWLHLIGTRLELEASLIQIDSGTVVASWNTSFHGLEHSEQEARASAANSLTHLLSGELASLALTTEHVGDGTTQPQIVVLGNGSAVSYIAFRRALRTEISTIEAVNEIWAAEGRIALSINQSDENADFQTIIDTLTAHRGSDFGAVRIDSVEISGNIITVQLSNAIIAHE